MIDLLYGQDQEVMEWVRDKIPHMDGGTFSNFGAIGVTSNGALIGGVVYHEYKLTDIQMSGAAISKKWLSHYRLMKIFSYPFIQLGCRRVTMLVPLRNSETRNFVEGLGFKQEGVLRQAFLDGDCVVYGMLKQECKWIGVRNG